MPDRVLRAIDHPTIDHRGPEFRELGLKLLRDVKAVFQTRQPVVVYPASGTGAWEAALVNTLSPGDKVLMYERGEIAIPEPVARLVKYVETDLTTRKSGKGR